MTPGRKDRAFREAMGGCAAVVALMAGGLIDAERASAAFDGIFYLLATYTGGNAAEWFARRPTAGSTAAAP
jgi:hypothetical protein